MNSHGSAVSLKDIAKKVGVSVMTVSNVLRPRKTGGRKLFSSETEKLILQASSELGYVPNRAARSMRTRETGVVAFASANFSKDAGTVENFGVHPFLVGLNHVLTPTNRHTAMVELDELELRNGKIPVALKERFFDALVVHHGLTPQALEVVGELELPVIFWDAGLSKKNNCVYRDELGVGTAATKRLVELGHRRIAFHVGGGENWRRYQTGEPVHFSFTGRYKGFAKTMKAHRLPARVLVGHAPEALAKEIEKQKITAVVAYGAYLSLLFAAAHLNKKIPGDLSIVATDIESSTSDSGRLISGAGYNRYIAGNTVAKMILQQLENGVSSIPSVRLPAEMVEGVSAGPCL